MPEIQTKLGKGLIGELDELAEKSEVTRSETIRMLLRYGLDDLNRKGLAEVGQDSDDEDEPEVCDKCEADLPDGAKYCVDCGAEVDGDDSTEEPEEKE